MKTCSATGMRCFLSHPGNPWPEVFFGRGGVSSRPLWASQAAKDNTWVIPWEKIGTLAEQRTCRLPCPSYDILERQHTWVIPWEKIGTLAEQRTCRLPCPSYDILEPPPGVEQVSELMTADCLGNRLSRIRFLLFQPSRLSPVSGGSP